MSYFRNIAIALGLVLREDDAFVSAATGGVPDQTVSMRVALAKQAGRLWGICFCKFLDLFVQRGHCDCCLNNGPMPWHMFVRAFVCFSFFLIGIPWTLAVRSWPVGSAWVLAMLLNYLWGLFL